MHFEWFKQETGFPGAGVFSVCSAHPLVLRTALRSAREAGTPVLVESTVNQVNPDGGYTGMRPADFRRFLEELAASEQFPAEKVILGSDHLGPYPWRQFPADYAMEKARLLAEQSVQAGYRKLHLDASMACSDDPATLPPEVIAERTAELAAVAEATATRRNQAFPLFYVVGTEVPPPGGAEQAHGVEVTPASRVKETVETMKQAFFRRDLHRAWERVIAVVVQPGVEFSNHAVVDYQSPAARELVQVLDALEGLFYEAHSTDYQLPAALRQLVVDGFAILKVGPWLTFALREGLLALANMEDELADAGQIEQPSRLRTVLLQAMADHPDYWERYYTTDLDKLFSLSDRIRYYWAQPAVQRAVQQLIQNLKAVSLPPGLVSQYFPDLFPAIRAGELEATPESLLMAKIKTILQYYQRATEG